MFNSLIHRFNNVINCSGEDTERLHKGKCEKCKSVNEYATVIEIINKNYQKGFDEGLTKRFKNTYQFCDGDINKFCVICKKIFIHMSTWIAGKDLMKHHNQKRKNFTVA